VEAAIDASRPLIELPEDWDGDGAYPITQATWDTAARVLRSAALTTHRRFRVALPTPRIAACRDGSIDLYWTTGTFTLLINVKPGAASDFYGERADKPGAKVQGPFSPEDPDFGFLQLLVGP
jgi:hypothetical protein